ncbi:DEKNAAC100082 [Brettanomyces naardenensis]|uniref:Dolichyl-diphosphooligosaccharide--protein glycosyltransferase subunit 1 n=1 Tax=Brettanomyces naardenensis TaxID=13370 RepID=A0A448YG78_BRENA|nr:DEKNAAC100082 [Brettanomyces naardenensis]
MLTKHIFSVLSYLLLAVTALQVEPNWEITNLERAIDVTKSYVKERQDIEAINIGSEPLDQFFIAVPKELDDSQAIMVPVLKSPKTERAFLVPKNFTVSNGDENVVYYSLQLPVPISPKSEITLSFSLIATNQLKPVPEYAPLADSMSITLESTKYPVSPYVIRKYAFAIIGAVDGKLSSDPTVEEPMDLEFNSKGGNLVADPTECTIQPNTYIPLEISFTKTEPLPYVSYLQRDYWISHWGNTLQLEEYYELTNKAVKLESGFNRAEWMNGQFTRKISPALTAVQIVLPNEEVSDAYFTDKVGNVSTSQFISERLVLKPRFPIFGGWHYNFTIGWNHHLSDFLKQGPSDEYILKVKLLDGLHDGSYEKVDFSVYLPEGAEYIDASVPFKYDNLSVDSSYSYLDVTTGRPKITLTFSNLVDELKDADVYVRYRYSFSALINKPLVTSMYVFFALMGLYVLRKVNVSIRPSQWK